MFVSVDRFDGVAVLRVDRPPANAIDVELLGELVSELERIAADPPSALVLAGREGFFSAEVDHDPQYRRGPFARLPVVVGQVTRAHHVQHGQRARAMAPTQGGEVRSLPEDPPKQIAHHAIWRVVFEAAGAKADEVHEHRLATAPVGATSRDTCAGRSSG